MSGVDAETSRFYRQGNDSYERLKSRWSTWLYLICQRDEAAAEKAHAALLEAIASHHADARALANKAIPRLHGRLNDRPRSKDEGDPYGR